MLEVNQVIKHQLVMINLKRVFFFPDVAKMKGINILESKNETQTPFEYLKNNVDEFFWLSRYF